MWIERHHDDETASSPQPSPPEEERERERTRKLRGLMVPMHA